MVQRRERPASRCDDLARRPKDTVMSIGCRQLHGDDPQLNFLVVAADADWGALEPGRAESVINQRLKAIAAAGTPAGR